MTTEHAPQVGHCPECGRCMGPPCPDSGAAGCDGRYMLHTGDCPTLEDGERPVSRIYVADLAAYNDGELRGCYIELGADTTADEIQEQIAKMLKDSPYHGEEWAVHDYDGDIAGLASVLGEWPDLERLAHVGNMAAKHGPAYVAYTLHEGLDYADDFEDVYCGEWESEEQYAEDMADDCGLVAEMGNNPLAPYIDWEAFARDLFMTDYYSVQTPSYLVYVFRRA